MGARFLKYEIANNFDMDVVFFAATFDGAGASSRFLRTRTRAEEISVRTFSDTIDWEPVFKYMGLTFFILQYVT